MSVVAIGSNASFSGSTRPPISPTSFHGPCQGPVLQALPDAIPFRPLPCYPGTGLRQGGRVAAAPAVCASQLTQWTAGSMVGSPLRKERVRLDSGGAPVTFAAAEFRDFDHGYATTLHKSQGATVDRSFVLVGPTMDRHLGYVAMTRHRKAVALYADDAAGRGTGLDGLFQQCWRRS